MTKSDEKWGIFNDLRRENDITHNLANPLEPQYSSMNPRFFDAFREASKKRQSVSYLSRFDEAAGFLVPARP